MHAIQSLHDVMGWFIPVTSHADQTLSYSYWHLAGLPCDHVYCKVRTMRRTACTQPCPPQVSGLGSCLCALLSATGARYLFKVFPIPLEFAGSDHHVVEGTVGASAQRQSDPYRHPSLLLLQQLYCRWPHGRHFADGRDGESPPII